MNCYRERRKATGIKLKESGRQIGGERVREMGNPPVYVYLSSLLSGLLHIP